MKGSIQLTLSQSTPPSSTTRYTTFGYISVSGRRRPNAVRRHVSIAHDGKLPRRQRRQDGGGGRGTGARSAA